MREWKSGLSIQWLPKKVLLFDRSLNKQKFYCLNIHINVIMKTVYRCPFYNVMLHYSYFLNGCQLQCVLLLTCRHVISRA